VPVDVGRDREEEMAGIQFQKQTSSVSRASRRAAILAPITSWIRLLLR